VNEMILYLIAGVIVGLIIFEIGRRFGQYQYRKLQRKPEVHLSINMGLFNQAIEEHKDEAEKIIRNRMKEQEIEIWKSLQENNLRKFPAFQKSANVIAAQTKIAGRRLRGK
jgi:uncharacterized membrane-anchored protein YhcB (DUF1043 family)